MNVMNVDIDEQKTVYQNNFMLVEYGIRRRLERIICNMGDISIST